MSKKNDPTARVTRSKETAKATYNALSRWYDLLSDRFERKYKDIGLQQLQAHDGERVLEIGFGTGYALAAIARAVGSTGKVCGIDLSEGMCRMAQARLEKEQLADRVELTCGDAELLPYADGSFDAAYMSFALELFDTPEIGTVLHECARVLKQEGRIVVVAMSKHDRKTLMSRLYEWAHRHFPRYVDCRPIPVRQVLEDAKFKVMRVASLEMFGLPVDVVTGINGD